MRDLKHVGILGMKWGIRKRGPASADHTESRTLKKKRTEELSNEEIRKVVTRLGLESQLKNLSPKGQNKGLAFVGKILSSKIGQSLINNLIKRYTKVNVDDIFGKDSPFDVSGAQEGQVIDLKFLKD